MVSKDCHQPMPQIKLPRTPNSPRSQHQTVHARQVLFGRQNAGKAGRHPPEAELSQTSLAFAAAFKAQGPAL